MSNSYFRSTLYKIKRNQGPTASQIIKEGITDCKSSCSCCRANKNRLDKIENDMQSMMGMIQNI